MHGNTRGSPGFSGTLGDMMLGYGGKSTIATIQKARPCLSVTAVEYLRTNRLQPPYPPELPLEYQRVSKVAPEISECSDILNLILSVVNSNSASG